MSFALTQLAASGLVPGLPHIGARRALWLPSDLFALSQPGIWLDGSTNDGLFQDALGTTPVTALGQPVGFAPDRRLWGGKTFAQVMTEQNNLLANPGGPFVTTDNWTRQDGNVTLSVDTGRLRLDFVGASNYAWTALATVAGQTYYVDTAFDLGSNVTAAGVSVRDQTAAGTPVVNVLDTTSTTSPIRFFFTALSAVSVLRFEVAKTNPATAFVLSASAKQAPGKHASQATSGSRPLYAADANGKPGLKFDGVDDFLVTPSIDFSASDKMLVSAGVRKLSDAAISIVAELSTLASANGAFYLTAPRNALTGDYGWRSAGGGNGDATTGNAYPAPQSSVLTGLGDISGDISRLRVNGSQVAESLSNQGAGNFGNYPLYIGRRAGSLYPYNGFIHQLVVRGGDLPDAAELAKLEAYIAGKSGVSL